MQISQKKPSARASHFDYAAWVLSAILLISIIILHLLPALLAGLLVFELVHVISPRIARHMPGKRSKFITVALLAAAAILLLISAIVGVLAFLHSDTGSLSKLFAKMAQILDDTRNIVPGWMLAYLPADANAIQLAISAWLRSHAGELQLAGTEMGRTLIRMLLGMIIGALLSVHELTPITHLQPFSRALSERIARLRLSFSRIVLAQVRIASINTIITTLYLKLILPLIGVHLPLSKTLIVITFITGLIPVVGNLISNTMIIIVSLSQSLNIALASVGFLLVIHKLEYFLNARIVGNKIHAHAWELLTAMLFMEAVFGMSGLIAAPIYYAYIKDELAARSLI